MCTEYMRVLLSESRAGGEWLRGWRAWRAVRIAVVVTATAVAPGAMARGEEVIQFRKAAGGAVTATSAGAVSPLSILGKERTRVGFRSAADSCVSRRKTMSDNVEYTQLDLPGGSAGGSVGTPRLPYYGRLVRVPDGAVVRLVIDSAEEAAISGRFALPPVQPAPRDDGSAAPAFTKNAVAYATDQWTPAAPVRIADRLRIRGREFIYVIYSPLTFNPVREALRAASRVEWHLEYDLPAGGVRAGRADAAGEEAFSDVFDLALDATVPEVFAPMAEAVPMNDTGAGADYLVITADRFAAAIQPLVAFRSAQGYTTRVVTRSEIAANATAAQISAFIQNAYDTWSPRPTYLLLVGDAPDLPPHSGSSHPGRNFAPANDLYYATVDGSDIFPDLFCGRLPCSSVADCDNMVRKILTHQTASEGSIPYRNSVLTVGHFQDSEGISEPKDGYEARLFMETCEAVRDFMVAQGQTVHTAYVAQTEIVPRRYNHRIDSPSILHTSGDTYAGTQTYRSDSDAVAEILARINNGVWLVQYRGHGGVTEWDSPRLTSTHVNGLSNGNRLPLVISVTCLTGQFDDASHPSLCEAFMNAAGGAACVVGATRVSQSWWNDWFIHGIYESLSPGYLAALSAMPSYLPGLAYSDNPVHRSSRMGQAINFAKFLMYDRMAMGSQEGLCREQYEILTLFGDPLTIPRPWLNGVAMMRVSAPGEVSAELAAFTVQAYTINNTPIANAKVTVSSTEGDLRVVHTGTDGRAEFSFVPVTDGYLSVTVEKSGYEGGFASIDVVVPTMTAVHPASVSAVQAEFDVSVTRNDTALPLAGASVRVTSEAGDDLSALTGGDGKAHFAFGPVSRDTLNIAVSKQSFVSYSGQIGVTLGTLSLVHTARIDECTSPVVITVLDGTTPVAGATVTVSYSNGVPVHATTLANGRAAVPIMPQGDLPLAVAVAARGYEGATSMIDVAAAFFVWDPLPDTLERGTAQRVRVSAVSSIDRSTVLSGYTGTATVRALDLSVPPPAAVITDCKLLGAQSRVIVQAIQLPRVSFDGWRLVCGGSSDDINMVDPDVRTMGGEWQALQEQVVYGPSQTPESPFYWHAPFRWMTNGKGWVMMLDEQTNVVDLVVWGWEEEDISTFEPVISGCVVRARANWIGDGCTVSTAYPQLSRIRSSLPADTDSAVDFQGVSSTVSPQTFRTPFQGVGTPLATEPEMIGPFVSGVWYDWLTVMEMGSNVLFRSVLGSRSGESETFGMTAPPHTQYGFGALTTERFWNAPFEVTVRAQDRYGDPVSDFTGQVRIYGFADTVAAPVLITECGILAGSANSVEIHNLSGARADTRGWRLVFGDDIREASACHGTLMPLPDELADGALFTVVEGRKPKLPADPMLEDLDWSDGNPGWVMLLDSSNTLVDFVAWGWQESQITGMAVRVGLSTVRVGAQWVGNGASANSRRGIGSLQRRGSSDYNRAEDFAWQTITSRGTRNAMLAVPLTDARRPIELVPSVSGAFTSGVWTGDVTVREAVEGMSLEVRDTFSRTGTSPRFNVHYLGPLTLTLPPLVTEGDGVLHGQGTIELPAGTDFGLEVSLSSSDSTELRVPNSVTILPRSTRSTFDIEVVDDALMDFTREVSVTATAIGYGPGLASVAVRDDEAPAMWILNPATTHEGAGTLSGAAGAELRLGATLASSTTFNLRSSDTSEIQVQSTLTIPAGRSSGRFALTVVDDAVADGTQQSLITATPDGYTYCTGTVAVVDNDAYRFAFEHISSVKTAGVPFSITMRAEDAAGQIVSNFTRSCGLTAAWGAGSLPVVPSQTGFFTNGQWRGDVSVNGIGSGVTLTATEGAATGNSDTFDVTHGPLQRFVWDELPQEPLHAGVWLPVRLTALDVNGFRVTSYKGPARLQATRHDLKHPVRVLAFVGHCKEGVLAPQVRAAMARGFDNFTVTETRTTVDTELERELESHHVLLIAPQDVAAPGDLGALGDAWAKVLPNFVNAGGVVVACSGRADEHVLLRRAQLASIEQIGMGEKDTDVSYIEPAVNNRLTAGVTGSFYGIRLNGYDSGDCGAVVISVTNRVPPVVSRGLGDGYVVMFGTDFLRPSEGLERIFSNAIRLGLRRVSKDAFSAPEEAEGFKDGVWMGVVQFAEEALDGCLRATEGSVAAGETPYFDVGPLRINEFSFDASGRMILRWNSAGATPYSVDHAEGGPDREFLPLVNGIWAVPPMNTFTGEVHTTEGSHFYRLRVPAP